MYKIVNKKKLLATKVADFIGSLLFMPKLLFRTQAAITVEDVKSILVIRTAYIGDVVMTIPILKPLKKKYPKAKLTFLTSPVAAPILQNNPYVDEVITYAPFWFYPTAKQDYWQFLGRIKKSRFDLVIEARGDIRELLLLVMPIKAKYKVSYGVGGGSYLLSHVVPYTKLKHKVDYHLDIVRYLGATCNELEWGIYNSIQEMDEVKVFMTNNNVRLPFIAVHPGSRLELKTWGAVKFAALLDILIDEYKLAIVVFGTKQESLLVDKIIDNMKKPCINLTGMMGIRTMAAIIGKAALFICNDSAPMHIAAAMKTPTVAIFGPSQSKETGPYGNHCQVVEIDIPCRYECDENSCQNQRHNACMEDINHQDVLGAVHKMLPRVKNYG